MREIEPRLVARSADLRVPGAAFALIADGEIALERAFGVKEAGGADPVTPTTRFQACSISKPITVLAMLRLVERGTLDLDADVNDVLTSWHVPPSASWQPRVTLRQIASHSAGLTVGGFPGYARGTPLPTLIQILTGSAPANTAGIRVDTLPGVEFRYAGGGTTVLQQVLEDVEAEPSGPLKDVARSRKLGLNSYSFDVRLDNQPVAGFGVLLSPGANALDVASRSGAHGRSRAELPAGVEWFLPFDATCSSTPPSTKWWSRC